MSPCPGSRTGTTRVHGLLPELRERPGSAAELLTPALNQQAMLWRTSPAGTELEEVALGWLRERGLVARAGLPTVRVYCSAQAHSSIDKAAIVLGLGQQGVRKIPPDGRFRLEVAALEEAIRDDEARGVLPIAVVATVGTTSSGSVDPVAPIASLCAARRVWLHVDASWAGPAAMLPEEAAIFDGVERADSVVVNPHKWRFSPLDLSAFYCRRIETLEAALALTPNYLASSAGEGERNLMDTGIALGRRCRGLKLWMVSSYFGANGLRSRLREHIRLARGFAADLGADTDFELLEPVSLGLVCFRAAPAGVPAGDLDDVNARLPGRAPRHPLGRAWRCRRPPETRNSSCRPTRCRSDLGAALCESLPTPT